MPLRERVTARLAGLLRSGRSRLRPRKNRPCPGVQSIGANEKLDVEILERRELPLPTVDGSENVEVWITYRFGTLPPGLLRINKKDLTEEKELAAIRADIQRRLAQQPKKVKV